MFGVTTGENLILKRFENPFPPPFDTNLWSFIFSVLIWVGIAVIFYFVVDPLAHLFTRKTESELDDILLRILRLPVFVLIVLIGTVSSIEILDLPGDVIANIETAYQIMFVLLGAWIAYKVYDEVVIYYGEAVRQEDQHRDGRRHHPDNGEVGHDLHPHDRPHDHIQHHGL